MLNAITLAAKDHAATPTHLVELFLFCQKPKQKTKTKNVQEELDFMDVWLENHVAFVSFEAVLQYSLFMDANHLLMRIFVPEDMIIGNNHSLMIKERRLTKKHVHGYYPGNTKGIVYIKNPHFDAGFLPLTS